MNKNIWVTATAAVVLVLATVLICWQAWGNLIPVSQRQIDASISELDPFRGLGLEISTVHVDDHRTDSANRMDYVWITMEAVEEETACVAQYKLVYHLYDQGWKLEEIVELIPDHWSYRPLRGVSAETADEAVKKFFGDRDLKVTDTMVNLSTGRCTYTYTENVKLAHCTRDSVVEARYYFDYLNGGWQLEACEEVQRVLSGWDIVGAWTGAGGEGYRTSDWSEEFTVVIHSMQEETANVSISHETAGTFFEGAIPVAVDSGIQFFVDALNVKTPYSFTLNFDGERAWLSATGSRHDEDLVRVVVEVEPETPTEPEQTETPAEQETPAEPEKV